MPDPSCTSLSVLLFSLGCVEIPKYILLCGLVPQKRWNDEGHSHEISLFNTGINPQYVHLFSSRTKLEQTIKFCIQDNVIIEHELEDASLVYSLTANSKSQIARCFNSKDLILPGMIFTAHIYPREENLQDSYV